MLAKSQQRHSGTVSPPPVRSRPDHSPPLSSSPPVLIYKISMSVCCSFFFLLLLAVSLSLPALIYMAEEQLSRAGREVGQAGWLQAPQGQKHWAHCLALTHTHSYSHAHACAVLNDTQASSTSTRLKAVAQSSAPPI